MVTEETPHKNAVKKALPDQALKPNESPATEALPRKALPTEALASKALLASEALAKNRKTQRRWL